MHPSAERRPGQFVFGRIYLHDIVRLGIRSFDSSMMHVYQQPQKNAQDLLCCNTDALLELVLLGLCLLLFNFNRRPLPSTCLIASSLET